MKALKEIYECPICHWKTKHPQGMGGHMKGHKGKGEVPVKPPVELEAICDICQKKYKSPHGVLVHKAQVHGQKRTEVKGEVWVGPREVLNPQEVAGELLTKVVDVINRDSNYQNQIAALNKEIFELEGRLKKEREEKEQILRAYNDLVKQGGKRLPSVERIITAIGKR